MLVMNVKYVKNKNIYFIDIYFSIYHNKIKFYNK